MAISDNAPFEFLPHTADVAVVIRGGSLTQLFEHAPLALFSVMTDLSLVQEAECREVEVCSQDPESLLVDWLNELLYLFETEGRLIRRCAVLELEDRRLRAQAWGERIDRSRHRIRTGVKAATYHGLEITPIGSGWQAKVVFDV